MVANAGIATPNRAIVDSKRSLLSLPPFSETNTQNSELGDLEPFLVS